MRLTTVRVTRDRTAAARIDKKHLTLLPHTDVGTLIASGPDWAQQAAADSSERLPLQAATPAEPLYTPARVIRVEANYPTRSKELGKQRPLAPSMCVTRPSATAGARATISLPALAGTGTGWGVELGVVIAHPAHRIAASTSFGHIAGYVVISQSHALDDAADRPDPSTHPLDPSLLIGPTLVTPDQLPPGGRGLTLTATLDGRLIQKANTSELYFDVATLVAHASTLTPLRPGDLIVTGTPGGTHDHPLADGQHLNAGIKGLGDIDINLTTTSPQLLPCSLA
ncbi:fumarylacetoacetate hydrolase family protein [Streptomyces longispororuber]|uniref:fumarylacetoacetate hydrolase family protein n=1 Tax=Streptomyces longispororuber TaxID=68230 RepID=UPI00210CCFC0|nr:fumarylacetoacetate hydrolase family protein [Streptomyces longispororuber]MCQ4205753.1 fumarylacetoacetate hydrolase family protein [Streptomyces longispororuber]